MASLSDARRSVNVVPMEMARSRSQGIGSLLWRIVHAGAGLDGERVLVPDVRVRVVSRKRVSLFAKIVASAATGVHFSHPKM